MHQPGVLGQRKELTGRDDAADRVVPTKQRLEPDDAGQWWADLSPVHGPRLGPFGVRSQALDAERLWLETHWLTAAPVDEA